MSGIQAKQAIKYAILPGIIPRLKRLFTSGFGQIAYLMATIYNMVRLLPSDHPYLNPRNIGRFGIRHVIAEAANNLVVSKKNIDQIAIFLLLLTGIVLLGLMIALAAFSLMFKDAFANNNATFTSMFTTAQPANDIAFMLLDQVFGIPNFFGSCVSTGAACFPGQTPAAFPWPFHTALQQIFRFYSSGILIIGALILLYFIAVIIIESATTGSPFGQRFKNMWVPVRLVVAVGLLIPLNYGYNAGQYIAFFAARMGSGLATNAWNLYNTTISTANNNVASPIGESRNMIALPSTPDASTFVQMMTIVHTCAFGYYMESGINKNQVPLPNTPARIGPYLNANPVKAYIIKNPQPWMTDQNPHRLLQGTTYDNALTFSQRSDIIIRFGRLIDSNKDGTINNRDDVDPTCGDIRIVVNDNRLESDLTGAQAGGYLGAVIVQRYFYDLVSNMWLDANVSNPLIQFSGRMYLLAHNNATNPTQGARNTLPEAMGCTAPGSAYLPSCQPCNNTCVQRPPDKDGNSPPAFNPPARGPVGAEWKLRQTATLQGQIDPVLQGIWQFYNQLGRDALYNADISRYGWGGAGIWYNTLAQANGAFTSAFVNYPNLDRYPKIMEIVARSKKKGTNDPSGNDMFNPSLGNDTVNAVSKEPYGMAMAQGLYKVHQYWNGDSAMGISPEKTMTTGALENAMNLVFGTHGLFSMLTTNAHTHPLAQLVTLGKGLVEASIRNIAGSTMIAAMGGVLGAIEPSLGPLASAAGGFMSSTAFIGLTAGFVLFYIVPFLPFVYFYFTVATWVKTIFEAMVGIPLWALAHLRLDGEGLPGDAAQNGYFLIFEIFIRPVLAVIGLIAGMVIFTAQVRILHFTWILITENVGGTADDAAKVALVGNMNLNRSIVDEFFFTVMYAMIVYMMATASFKLIDRIPDNLLRWMGQGVSSFSDINTDATEGLTRYAAIGGMQAGQQITGGLNAFSRGIGNAIK